MTSFLNLSINENNIKFKVKKYRDYWYEIDSEKDLKLVSKKFY